MKKYIIFICVLLLSIGTISAQKKEFTISGIISDSQGPLPGVSISIQDKPSKGCISDANGKFLIKVERGDKLIFSYVGMKNVEYLVTKLEKNLDIKFVEAENKLDEVVVTALGKQRRISTLSAVTAVNVGELQQPVSSVANLLGGRVAGIISTMASGEPGKNIADFWIRGIGTFGANSSALVLIDGLEGDINSLDPADIESFSVLKDASATAVYGVRGANGVVLITTKRGNSEKINITGRADITMSYLNRLPHYLHSYEYAQLANEARAMRGEDPIYSKTEMEIIKNHLDSDLYPDVNWQDEMIKRTSWQKNIYVSAQGGAKIAKYFVSLATSSQDAAYKVDKKSLYSSNVGYNTYSYRANIDLDLTPTTKVYFGTNGFMSIYNQPGVASTDNVWQAASQINPLRLPVIYSNGEYPSIGGTGASISPYVMINRMGQRSNQVYQGEATFELNQNLSFITKGLTIRAQGAFNLNSYYNETRSVCPALYEAVGRAQNGSLITILRSSEQSASFSKSTDQYRKYHFESTMNYERVFNSLHHVSGLLYYYMYDEKTASAATSNMYSIPWRYQGMSSRLTYDYNDTYMMDFNFGYTGSANFQKGHRFGFFPSIAVGWVPTAYSFVQKALPFLDFLKIRCSYGTVGNDQITSKRFPYLTLVDRTTVYPFGSQQGVEGLNESYIAAENLKWERAKKFDLGFEGKLFKEKLSFVLDFFHDTRDGIFQQRIQIPIYAGLVNNPYSNVGKMVSFGADGNFTYTKQFNKNLQLTLRGNFTYSKNDVKHWEEANSAYPYQKTAGYPYGVTRGYRAIGLFKDQHDIDTSPIQSFSTTVMPGDIKYKDINGDGVINSDDQVPLSYGYSWNGSYSVPYPNLMYGLGFEVVYKQFSMGVLFKGTGKTDYYSMGYGYVPFYQGVSGNVLTQAYNPKNRWISKAYCEANGIDVKYAENPKAMYPRMEYGYNSNNSQTSDFWLHDARYLRLQELTFNYHWATKFIKQLGLTAIDIEFIGNNLLCWDKVKIFDPEQANQNGCIYPIPTTYALQLYIHF
ncbi:MAG: TonB-dependent receptor [Bacteroidales bacterium]|nr:TonB-dependent receptor [Bacteroidales bacterium]